MPEGSTTGAWVKPDWARPDDEEPVPPEPAPEVEKSGDNPY
jgi:hypothetical protein